ncbi:MAG: preprotein translocase subunit SecG [Gammaproteobacteria bacterium]
MESLQTILLVAQVLIAMSLIGLILIQHGKGADAGAAFGSGASSTVFGSQGSSNFLTKTTAILAFLFLTNSLSLAYIASKRMSVQESLMLGTEQVIQKDQTEMQIPTSEIDLSEMISEDDIPMVPDSTEEIPTITESGIPALPTE